MIRALGGEFGLTWESAALAPGLAEKAAEIAAGKYRTAAWNERI
jgi:hypothetical protein